MQGHHLTADLHHLRCETAWLLRADMGLAECLRSVREAGLTAVAQLVHRFESSAQQPSGDIATMLLDVFVCNFSADHSAKAHALMDRLLALLGPPHVQRHALQCGSLAVAA